MIILVWKSKSTYLISPLSPFFSLELPYLCCHEGHVALEVGVATLYEHVEEPFAHYHAMTLFTFGRRQPHTSHACPKALLSLPHQQESQEDT